MDTSNSLPNRLRAGSAGLGHADRQRVERRAAELAHSDGRSVATEADFVRATEELAGGSAMPAAPEIPPNLEAVAAWDQPPDQTGRRAPSVQPENATNLGEQLVQEGLDEADHDSRVVAEEKGKRKA